MNEAELAANDIHRDAKLAAAAFWGADLLGWSPDFGARVIARPGRTYRKKLPHSEVCMHFQKAGLFMSFKLDVHKAESCGSPYWSSSVQLYNEDGSRYSGPITPGEAGLYYLEPGPVTPEKGPTYYFYPDGPG